ncbi:MAG: GAF domain-containing protein [Candidatus Rokuibacteriota bacterium]|nr:MAG: GAF domain-containing protein [Candidatus Rokubacteria bacterium]
MPRRVLFDAGSRAAASAAATLADEYDVQPWAADGGAEGVVLTGAGGAAAAAERTRLIGIVDAAAPGPWPATWYGLVPAGAARPLLERAVANAFADLDAAAERARLERELGELNAIGIQLSAERNLDVLLETILTKAREITRSDAGSLYLVEEAPDGAPRLRFALAQNESVEIPFRAATLPLNGQSVAGHVALTGTIVNLADAYEPPPGSPFQINRWFDEHSRYRTKSMLVVPMRTPQGEMLGALQLINCKPEGLGPLRSPEEAEQHVRAYGERHERLAGSLASQAAVALANRRLYESISQLFEGFVKASVTAIESRDPTTFGHSFRVADLTVGLAEAMDRADSGPYRNVRFAAEELRELRYAALLHDFGKVGVREHVLVKSKKLYPADLERIRQRIELLMRDLELGVTRRKLDWAVRRGKDGFAQQAARLDDELAAAIAELDEALDVIVTVNEPSVRPQDFTAQLLRITARGWQDHRGRLRTVLTPEEASILAITKGSLTEAERREIQQHVVHTFQFLAQIPWTREFRRIPEIARSHHEKLDGSGYPFGFRGEQIPVQSRMMTIADIYDALTATDRPYKKAVRVEEALDTLREEQRAGALDGSLLDLFIDARVFERTDWR